MSLASHHVPYYPCALWTECALGLQQGTTITTTTISTLTLEEDLVYANSWMAMKITSLTIRS